MGLELVLLMPARTQTFGERVAAILAERGIQQKALSAETEIPYSTLSNVLKGITQDPGVYDAAKIARFLKIPLADLLESDSIPASPLTPYDTNPDYQRVIGALEELTPKDRRKALEFISWVAGAIARADAAEKPKARPARGEDRAFHPPPHSRHPGGR